jgi:4-aminobutyrate aminotransferase-like enzyme
VIEIPPRVLNALRDDRGRTGREENVLEIRPPLVFAEHADLLVEALARATTGS